jgi:hypothetical protein
LILLLFKIWVFFFDFLPSVDVPETYTWKQLLSQNTNLSMHVCKATIQVYQKKYFKNPELFPDF